MNTIKNSNKGQTMIETALLILLLFVIFFGIAEVARFWWLKNQLNNAGRVGVRVAIVDSSTFFQNTGGSTSACNAFAYSGSSTCTYATGTGLCNAGTPTNGAPSGPFQAACSSITNSELCGGATVSLGVTPVNSSGECGTGGTIVSPGGIINMTVTRSGLTSVVPGLASLSFGLIPSPITLTGQSTMRHE